MQALVFHTAKLLQWYAKCCVCALVHFSEKSHVVFVGCLVGVLGGKLRFCWYLGIFMAEETQKCSNHILILVFFLSLKFLWKCCHRTATDGKE
jgi:hypothetical protein